MPNYILYENFLHNSLQSNDMGQLSVCYTDIQHIYSFVNR
ncbi:hypothetical protein MICAB_150007 [Microcystis aeruginosa PCC 9717]|uniref:Uncharacterized protein n=1 Tax=Microcystis aeruginosa PCC 9717 TaxID=1160286 RepID=I4FK91_MICAE|nr:hypothetical protein MICAB_150007 [Microcystis aeruginosa PCC 9717]